MHHILRLIEGIVDTAFFFVEKFFEALFTWIFPNGLPKKKQGYGASFGSPKSLLKRNLKGFCLTGEKSLSVEDSYKNSLLIGSTGSGKSSVVFVPSLLRMNASYICHDPSGELAQLTTPALKRRGYIIKTLNFADPKHSDRFNPLYRARSSSDINKVSSLVIRTALGGVKGDPFWNLQATALLTLLITLVKAEVRERQTFRQVRHYLNQLSGDEAFFTRKVEASDNLSLRAEFKTFQAYDNKVKAGIIATVSSALHIFTDEAVAEVTNHDTIALHEFRLKKTVLFIQNPVTDQAYYAMLSSLFFEQLFGELLVRMPQPWHQDVFCLIDEAGVLYLPSLGNVISNVRKYRAGILLGIQQMSQLVHNFGPYEASTIAGNCFAKLYFTGQSGRSSEELEQRLGRYQYEDNQGRTQTRPLITRDEVRTMKQNQGLLMAGNYPPMLLNLKPYYQQRGLLALTQLSNT
ncbi:MAG: type IV secretory system conjugative DNA transfer family protein [Bacteroidia bacterium]|nr:type IV secretory system conjugative DNA transfer family protein [Bacteroidia bacterium]